MKNNKLKLIFMILFSMAWSMSENYLPSIYLKDIQNNKKELKNYYLNGPVLINFWNLACEPCKKEMKELDKIHLKYNKDGFNVVSINIDNTRSMSKVKSYVNSQKYAFDVLNDPRASLFRKLGGKVMPFVVIADTSGKIISRHVGYNPGDEIKLEKEILDMLDIVEKDSLLSPNRAPVSK